MSPIPEEKHLNQRRQFSQEDLNQKHCNVLINELTAQMISERITEANDNNYNNVNSHRNLEQNSDQANKADTNGTQITFGNNSENDSNREIQTTNYENSLPQDAIQSSEIKSTNDELKQSHYIKQQLGQNNPLPSGHYITLSQINSYANQS